MYIVAHGYTDKHRGVISATIDGVVLSVPNAPGNRHRQLIAEWEAEGNTIPPWVDPVPLEARLLDHLNTCRKAKADSGVVVEFDDAEDLLVKTTDRSRNFIKNALERAKNDSKKYTGWLRPDGRFQRLENKDIKLMSATVDEFIDHCFRAQEAVQPSIIDGTLTTEAEVATAYEAAIG